MRVRIPSHLGKALRRSTRLGRSTYDRITQKPTPRSILNTLNDRALSFFDRTIPTGDKYPYEVHYAPALQNVPTGVEPFHLVGRAWRKTPDAPVALAFGFNAWKYGFIADYCPEVRIAFAPRKFLGWDARQAAKTMQPAPSRIYVWGYTDPSWLARFARKRGIPLIRVEDGFLRSADLGASHATPYSLVFDSKGLYYNTSEPNDLADILANHDFAGDAELMENARAALDLLIEKRLSKYNLPDVGDPTRHFAVKTRRRVLVLGQVDNDAAVRMGNPAGWRMSDMVRLAKLENPNAEILYRPHPEIYKGYQRSRLKADQIERFARIVSPDGPLIDLFETVDHVYTLSSLSGLEALLRGLEVTTLGTPFYAGWGLTDDRTQQPRGRSLSVLELFAGVYLKYPRYLADLENAFNGLQSATFRIVGEKRTLEIVRKHDLIENGDISKRDDPLLILADLIKNEGGSSLFNNYDKNNEILKLFSKNKGGIFHRISATIIARQFEPSNASSFFERCIADMDPEAANHFLLDVHRHRPEMRVGALFAELAKHRGNYQLPYALHELIEPKAASSSNNRQTQHTAPEENLIEQSDPDAQEAISERYLERGLLLLEAARFSSALNELCAAVLNGHSPVSLLEHFANIAWQEFDIPSAFALAKLEMLLTAPKTPWALRLYWRAVPYTNFAELPDEGAFCSVSRMNMTPVVANRLEDMELNQEAGISKQSILNSHLLSPELSVSYAQTLLELGKFEEALEVSRIVAERDNSYQAAVVLSRSLGYLDRYEEAAKLMDRTLSSFPNQLVYDEALKVCLYVGDYKKADRLLAQADEAGIDVGDVLPRKIAFGHKRVREAFLTFRKYKIAQDMVRAYPDKHIANNDYDYHSGKSILLLPSFGPGDEIRFASMYADLADRLPFEEFHIGVEPRLFELLDRSINARKVHFFPTQRILRNERADLSKYDKVPFADLMSVMDNTAAEVAEKVDRIALITDILADVLPTTECFSGNPFLVPDPVRMAEIKQQLPDRGPLIGLNWRSSITLQSRMEHYVSVQDLAPLFEQTDFQFVNLQYDDCEEEIAWIEERFPGRVFQVQDLNQYDDLDGVAALLKCLDLVIAPCTTVAELSGAVDQQTFILANSSELQWRIRPEDGRDIWHHSMEHIQGNVYRDKASLVTALIAKLRDWATRRN